MNFTFTLFVVLLFVVLSPGILLSLPSKGSLLTKVLVHAVVFALVFYLTAPTALQWSVSVEGFRPPPASFGMGLQNTTPTVPMDGSDRMISTNPSISSTGVKKTTNLSIYRPILDMFGYQV
jgi:hypothetical protein